MFVVPKRQPRESELAFADADAVAAAFTDVRSRSEPTPPPLSESSGDAPSSFREALALPTSVAGLRALPIKALKVAMAKLGIGVTPGSEKEGGWRHCTHCYRWLPKPHAASLLVPYSLPVSSRPPSSSSRLCASSLRRHPCP